MATQRIGSGVVLFLIAAAGVVLLRPAWFPDIPLPAALVDAGMERAALGGFLLLLVAVILTGIFMEQRRAEERRHRSQYVGPVLGAVSDEPVRYAAPEPYRPVVAPAWPSDTSTEQALEPAVEPIALQTEPEPEPEPEPIFASEPEPTAAPEPEPAAVVAVEKPAADTVEAVEAVEAPRPSNDPVDSPWPAPARADTDQDKT